MAQKRYYYGEATNAKEQDLFWTSDIGLAATLLQYYNIQEINKNDPKRMNFGFNRIPVLEKMVEQYWAKELTVEPQDFYLRLMQLRSRINQEKSY